MSKTREYIEKNAFKHDVIEMDYELLMGTIEAQKEEIAELKKEVKHWKSNHDNIAKRLRDFTCRPDLNVNKLEKEIAVLRKEALYKTHNDLSTVRGREQQIIDNLPDELKR